MIGESQARGAYNEPCADLVGLLSLALATEVMQSGACKGLRWIRQYPSGLTRPAGQAIVMVWFKPRRRLGIRRVRALESLVVHNVLGGMLLSLQ